MPASTTSIPHEQVEYDNPPSICGGGSGPRPPEDEKHTGGNGEGDEYRGRTEGHKGPREELYRHRISLFTFLIGDTMIFLATAGVYLVNRSASHINAHNRLVQDWRVINVPSILWMNTCLLLLSSITMELARRSMFREQEVLEEWLGLGKPTTKRVLPWLIATIVLGLGFVGGQIIAWSQVMSTPMPYSGQSRQSFNLLTGLHAAHVLGGLCALFACLIAMARLKRIEKRQILVDCTAWYWHAMGVFWIAFLVLIEFFR